MRASVRVADRTSAVFSSAAAFMGPVNWFSLLLSTVQAQDNRTDEATLT